MSCFGCRRGSSEEQPEAVGSRGMKCAFPESAVTQRVVDSVRCRLGSDKEVLPVGVPGSGRTAVLYGEVENLPGTDKSSMPAGLAMRGVGTVAES
ncbi:MAG: hypothetical protein OXF02_01210 [Simkaniaceae bacterium]|nr:hypothetical protein [Simkaniaceae bacterium]